MSLTTRDISAIERTIANTADGPERWLLQLGRLNILLPEGVPIEVLAKDWGISEDEAEIRLASINDWGSGFVEEVTS